MMFLKAAVMKDQFLLFKISNSSQSNIFVTYNENKLGVKWKEINTQRTRSNFIIVHSIGKRLLPQQQ